MRLPRALTTLRPQRDNRRMANDDDQPIDPLALYLHLARASELRRQPLVRDRLLVIAAAEAAAASLPRIAAFCRDKVLSHNHGHMLRRWETVEEATGEDDFLLHLKQLRRRFPPEKAEQMLHSLNIDSAGQRAAYYNDEEYAASIFGLTLAELEQMFPGGEEPAE